MNPIFPFPAPSAAPTTHAPCCDRESHEECSALYDATAPCTSPVRVERLDGRHRVAVLIEATDLGPRVLLMDCPTPSDRLTPDGARRLAALLAEVADLADGGGR